MTQFSSLLIGDGPLLVQCGERLLARGNSIACVVTGNPDIRNWAGEKGLRVETSGKDLENRISDIQIDWLLSISNLSLIPDAVLSKAARGAVNFHDGPLPRYAGLNAPLWALMNRETQHGVSWHLIEGGVDEGDILEQRLFDLTPDDTALSVNTKCYGAAIESFDAVLNQLEGEALKLAPQDLSRRNYCAGTDRPEAAAHLDFNRSADDLVALVRALDHGGYENPLALPKIAMNGRIICVGSAEAVPFEGAAPAVGTVIEVTDEALTIATTENAIRLADLREIDGQPAKIKAASGDISPMLSSDQAADITSQLAAVVKRENHWRAALKMWANTSLPMITDAHSDPAYRTKAITLTGAQEPTALLALIAGFVARQNQATVANIAFDTRAQNAGGYLNDWAPLRFEVENDSYDAAVTAFQNQVESTKGRGSFASDLVLRIPDISAPDPTIGFTLSGGKVARSALTFDLSDGVHVHWDSGRLNDAGCDLIIARLQHFAATIAKGGLPFSALPVMPDAERSMITKDWNDTTTSYDPTPVHQQFEAQVARTPDAVAVVFEGQSLTYAALNGQANKVAHVLVQMGVKAETLVGLYMERSVDLLIGALAIQKAGGAYVPLDPAFPVDRIAHYIKDSGAPVILTHAAKVDALPDHDAEVLVFDMDARISDAETGNIDSAVKGENLAYMIYTSGSTGVPKGVMVEHRNVANFFAGMDYRIKRDENSVWLALTSLSFDISVLELFYTLARGFKLVISGDESRSLVSSGQMAITDRHLDFSLFYWGNDDGPGPRKYKLLLDGAKFADTHGFSAVWTPERHFHAFGGPYPNPSITGAAVAAVTNNIAVRSGSCVAPLHHPARIAEEWAVIDNLTNGRAGLGIASGWQPDDFVLRPENTPPENKAAMYDSIKILRKLWRGEAVEFPRKDGSMHAVITQPRPVSKELPIWVTIAGNPQTWVEAGELGTNVLTHLLGQSVAEVGEKIKLYHQALRDNGHDPKDFNVTLMLHTYVASDREEAREVARGPMKEYMGAAAGLIKQSAWDFPAFKRPKGVKNSFELNLELLSGDELEAILDFAFERYFEDSGLFGTIDDCLARCEQLKRIGVDEIGCLIDYGIAPETVMEGLKPLAEVLKRTNAPVEIDPEDFSIAAQIARHKVTHLQCTPSMARMLVMNDEAGQALRQVQHLMIGGEALPGALVHDLQGLSDAHIENMYGPTETTIWSTTETALGDTGLVNIGRPIANTQVYILDDGGNVVPVGSAGELCIGGAGVTRGYWQREDLTNDRFIADPFSDGGRLYRTGDLVRWRTDGKIDFLGRLDNQIKLRGYRIEIGEIESRLEEIDGINQAIVILREDTPGDKRLVAYLQASSAVKDVEIRADLSSNLPDYMLPAHFVRLEQFPLTPNKKIDRKALPAPQRVAAVVQDYAAPTTGHDAQIADIWSRILGIGKVGARDSFFELGGHSLLAVQAHREIRETLGVPKLSITDIFRFPVLSDLSERIESLNGKVSVPAQDTEKQQEKVQARSDAMSKRRAMRAARQKQTS